MGNLGRAPQMHLIPVEDYPEALILPRYAAPPIYQGLAVDADVTVTTQVMMFDGPLEGLHRKHGATVFKVGTFNPMIFAQVLEKIAHSYVAANEKRQFKPLLRGAILEGRAPLYFVGSAGDTRGLR